MIKFIISVGFLFIMNVSWAIDLRGVNFDYKYDANAGVQFKYQLKGVDNQYQLVMRVKTISPDANALTIRIIYQRGYVDDGVTLDSADTLVVKSLAGNTFVCEYQFKKDSARDLLVAVVDHKTLDATYYFDIPVSTSLDFPPVSFAALKNDTTFHWEEYVHSNDEVIFSRPELHIFQYTEEFPAAKPPMSGSKSVSKSLKVDSIFSTGRLKPEINKLYFIQSDTTNLSGLGVLGVPPVYPKFITIDDIIQPLIYISKSSEFDEISLSDNPKLSMDRFWLDITGSKERAVSAIRRYFQNVTEANAFFTNYKQGWKTDRGMVYIIFGKPASVRRSHFQETWTYRVASEELEFTFNKVKNIFTSEHYDLERSEDYSENWFRQVDLWRKGRI